MRIAERRSISDLARDARGLIEKVRQSQEPIVITRRGRDVAVLVPIELYRTMEGPRAHGVVTPRLVYPEDAEKLRMEMTVVEENPAL